jgi:hypothetical protein
LRDDNHILSKARHGYLPPCKSLALDHINVLFVNRRGTPFRHGFFQSTLLKPASPVAASFGVLLR